MTNDGVVDETDLERAREHVVWRTSSGPFVADRSNVVGPADAGATDCTVEDVFVLERAVNAAPVTLGDVCDACLGS